jgi:hypothetical protein
MDEQSTVITSTAAPSKEMSPVVRKNKQAKKTSSDLSEMIATLIRENKLMQEKLDAINSKENTSPNDNRDIPSKRSVPEKNNVPDDRSASDDRHVPDGRTALDNRSVHDFRHAVQNSNMSVDAIRREERLAAALYKREQQLQQKDLQLEHYHILYGYPFSGK